MRALKTLFTLFLATPSISSSFKHRGGHLFRATEKMAQFELTSLYEGPVDETLVVIAAARWKKSSMQFLSEVEILDSDDVKVTKILVDEDEESEEKAMSLNMTDIPSVNVYKGGKLSSSIAASSCTIENVKSAIAKAIMFKDAHQVVANDYSATVKGAASCCVSVDSTMNGYSMEDLMVAANANLGLGCGNPLNFADLKIGETVVDLGSGAGIDCFIAGKQVGAEGSVIGVDMTPDMLFEARKNAQENSHTNVQFRLGEIEHLPVADNSVDVVISNCVVNLSPDKAQVFADIFRVLKPGGRIAISDVVERTGVTMPASLRTAEALSC